MKIKNFHSFYFKDFSKWMLLNKIRLELFCIINVPLSLVRENKLKRNQISAFESCYKDPSDFLYCVSKNLSNLSSAKKQWQFFLQTSEFSHSKSCEVFSYIIKCKFYVSTQVLKILYFNFIIPYLSNLPLQISDSSDYIPHITFIKEIG